MENAKRKLIRLLQKAHAGERAAALAYNGHWKSLHAEQEIDAVKQIERDEWMHRRQLAEMLSKLNAEPLFVREALFYLIGVSVAVVCHFSGRFCSTYFAGVMENLNVAEYELASEYSEALGLRDFAVDFQAMARAEARHETVLQKMICEHPLLTVFAFFFRWGNNKRTVSRRRKVEF